MRAVLMTLIAISGEWSGRIYRPERALAFVGIGMLMWNPLIIAYDPGFQLSFLATLGLIVFSPILADIFSRIPLPRTLCEILVATMSAQLAVMPLLLYESGL